MRISVPPLSYRYRESRFFSALVFAMAIAVVAGYVLSGWFPGTSERVAVEYAVSVPAAAVIAWVVVLAVQATLVRTGSIQVHRRFGLAGMAVAAGVVVVGTYGVLRAAAQAGGFPGAAVRTHLAVPFFDLLLFALFVTLAFRLRHGRKAHKRLMILATVSLLDAALVRMLPLFVVQSVGILAGFWLADVFIIVLAVWDYKSLGRLHPATLWGGLLTIASQPLRLGIAGTEGWQALAHRAMELVQNSAP